jgi:glutamyl-tRNA synthetase
LSDRPLSLAQYESLYPPRDLPPGAEVTRVAPSPTGRPHIGTALQAVVDRALADKTGGRFILRIEDTDRKRLDDRAVHEILAALEWLGIAPDEGPEKGGAYGPYVQSERLPIYQAAAEWLLEQGYAYRCFCTPERLEAMRLAQQAVGGTPMYDRHCRNLDPEVARRRAEAGEQCVIRLIVPDEAEFRFQDPLRGEIVFDSRQVDDQVLLKSDGFPTYHLAVVVDDHFMRVTTAIRGEEWISSTPKHLLLYRYFGWEMPRIVHTPLLRDASRRKLSKRSGDTSIEWYRNQGYLPEGFRNFLTRIIWAHPEEKDVYPYEEYVRLFQIEQLSKAGPVADRDLLDFINGQYLRELDPGQFYEALDALLARIEAQGEGVVIEEGTKQGRVAHELSAEEVSRFAAAFRRDPDYSRRVLTLEPERFKKLGDFVLQYAFFLPDLYAPPSPEALAKQMGSAEAAAAMLRTYLEQYDFADGHEQWEAKIRQQAEGAGVKAGKLFMTLRLALTGAERTPPLYEVTQILGADEVRRRLQLTLEALTEAA